jgi:hypothetical protein
VKILPNQQPVLGSKQVNVRIWNVASQIYKSAPQHHVL